MAVYTDAEFRSQASQYSGSGDWLDEANSHDVTNESAVFLDFTTDGLHFWFPPHSGQTITSSFHVPDSAGNSITAVIDARYDIAPDDWSPSWTGVSPFPLMGKYENSDKSWITLIQHDGTIRIYISDDGSAVTEYASTAATGFANGSRHQLRYLIDTTNNEFKVFTRDPGTDLAVDSGWSQLGTTVAITENSLNDSGERLGFNEWQSAAADNIEFRGILFRALLLDGEGGTPFFDTEGAVVADPALTFVEGSAQGATATIDFAAGNGSGDVIVVTQDTWAHGDMYLADAAGLDHVDAASFTLSMKVRPTIVPAADGVLMSKRAGFDAGDPGYVIVGGSLPGIEVADGSAETNDFGASGLTAKTEINIVLRYDATTPELELYLDGVGTGSPGTGAVGDLSNALNLYLMSRNGSDNFVYGEIFEIAGWNRALTEAEITEVYTGIAVSGRSSLYRNAGPGQLLITGG